MNKIRLSLNCLGACELAAFPCSGHLIDLGRPRTWPTSNQHGSGVIGLQGIPSTVCKLRQTLPPGQPGPEVGLIDNVSCKDSSAPLKSSFAAEAAELVVVTRWHSEG